MSLRDRLPSVSIAPGSILKTSYFNLASSGSLERNVDMEFHRRTEHTAVSFIVTIPTFYDDDFASGYVSGNALLVSRNSGDFSKIDINAGVAYIGGRRYKQISNITGYTLSGTSDATYFIRIRYSLSTQTFTFIAETTATADTKTVKYLTLASASWNPLAGVSGEWRDDFLDLRATNTALSAPVTITGNTSDPIMTLKQDGGTGQVLRVITSSGGGGVQFFDTANTSEVRIYGDTNDALTLYNGTSSIKVVSDTIGNTMLVKGDIKATSGYFGTAGPIIISGQTMQGFNTLEFQGTTADIQGTGGVTSIGFNTLNFTGVGTIGSGAVTSTGVVQGTTLTSTILTGTAPFTVSSTTKVSNLNSDAVDGYHFTGAGGNVTADASELNLIDGYTGTTTDLNRIKQVGRTQGQILYASAADTLGWLSAADGILRMTSGTPAWTLTPSITGLTVAPATGITFSGTGTQPVITSASTGGALYIGDTITISDKASSPNWNISGAGAGTFASVNAPTITAGTTLSVTSGPSLTSSGIATAKALSGVTTISGTGNWKTTGTIDFTALQTDIHVQATKENLNAAAFPSGRLKGDIWYASAVDTLGWLGIGSAGQYLRVVSGAPAWQTLPTYDNYVSWTYQTGGTDRDTIGSGERLNFVNGTNTTVSYPSTRQVAYNATSTGTASNGSSVPITSGWAYNHAVISTTNQHTKVGTIDTGVWQGTAIANAYVAGLDQNCLTTSSPLFAQIYTSSGTGTPSSGRTLIGGSGGDCYIKFGTPSKYLRFFYNTGPPSNIRLITDADRILINTLLVDTSMVVSGTISSSLLPTTTELYNIGSSSFKWLNIYGKYIYSGDIILENGMIISEKKIDGIVDIDVPSVQFLSTKGDILLQLDNDGTLHLKNGADLRFDL